MKVALLSTVSWSLQMGSAQRVTSIHPLRGQTMSAVDAKRITCIYNNQWVEVGCVKRMIFAQQCSKLLPIAVLWLATAYTPAEPPAATNHPH